MVDVALTVSRILKICFNEINPYSTAPNFMQITLGVWYRLQYDTQLTHRFLRVSPSVEFLTLVGVTLTPVRAQVSFARLGNN